MRARGCLESREPHRVLRLGDGRLLGWDEWGDPDGSVVVAAHGGLSCRLDSAGAHVAARAAGVRWLAPDRPGIGASDPRPGRRILDWAGDVEELLDRLGVGEVSLFGWSAGGCYALGTAWRLAERTRRVALVAATTDLSGPTEQALLHPADRVLTRACLARPVLTGWTLGAVVTALGRWPDRSARALVAGVSAAERGELERSVGALEVVRWVLEAGRRGGEELVADYAAYSDRWGFALHEIPMPVCIWQGTEDSIVSPGFAPRLAHLLPHAALREVSGAGHFLAQQRWDEICDWLAAR